MEISKLELQNFKQIQNESIEFSQDPDNNVTVVHGANGSGKTTLLNAFTWLFYDKVDFDAKPERLINEGTMAAADVDSKASVTVELQFEHEGTSFIATREKTYQKQSEFDYDGIITDSSVSLRRNVGGSWKTVNNPNNSLNQILPERLSSLFFFDGEDISELAGVDNQERVQDAIQNIMGLTILERAVRHLGDVASRFEDEVDEHASDELSALIDQKRDIKSEIEGLQRDLKDTERAIDELTLEIQDVKQKINQLGESAELQETRDNFEAEKKEKERKVQETQAKIRQLITDAGFAPMAMPLIKETADYLDQMRKDGLIPSELSNSYIDALLDSGTCLCGRPLEEETLHYEQVAGMKGEVLEEGVEQNAMRIIGHLNDFSDRRNEFSSGVKKLLKERKKVNDRIDELEESIDEVSSKLKDIDQTTETGESVGDLERRRESTVNDRGSRQRDKDNIEKKLKAKESELEGITDEIEAKRDEQEETLVAKRRQKATELARNSLDTSFSDLKDQIRERANKEVEAKLNAIANKQLTAEITTDFKLKIWKSVGEQRVEVNKSTGERQIASLAFIGSLVKIAKQRYESKPDAEYFSGGIYPLVMDSPFGALDKYHRREVSRVIPTLANQVVVFATDSQWEGPVEEEMSTRVGKQYWLDFDEGNEDSSYPLTRIKAEEPAIQSD